MNRTLKKVLLTAGALVVIGALFVVLVLTDVISTRTSLNAKGNDAQQIPGTSVVETSEEKAYREQAFAYVPKDAMLLAQVNTKNIPTKELDSWWDWYRQMSPHPQSLPKNVSQIEGLQSIVLTYYPSSDNDFNELYMFNYSYILVFDTTESRDNALTPLFEATESLTSDQGTSGAAEQAILDSNDKPLIVYTPVSSFSDIKDLEEGTRKPANLDEIPVLDSSAPTLYLNPNEYIDSYVRKSDNAGELYAAFGQAIKRTVFAVEEDSEIPSWIGTSTDFGKTWIESGEQQEVKKTYDRLSQVDPTQIDEVTNTIFNEIMGQALNEQMEAENYPGYAYGGLEINVDEGLQNSISIKTPHSPEPYGEAISQYEGGKNVIAESANSEEFVMVISPRTFHDWYASTGLYTQIATVTIRSTPTQNSIEFEFDDAGIQ